MLNLVKDYCVDSKTHHDIHRMIPQIFDQWMPGGSKLVTMDAVAYSEDLQATVVLISQSTMIEWG